MRMMGCRTMEKGSQVFYLRIANQADRVTVASILYANGYSVQPVRRKKNGRSYEYLVKFWIGQQDVEDVEVPE